MARSPKKSRSQKLSSRRTLLKSVGATAIGVPLIGAGTAAASDPEGEIIEKSKQGADSYTELGLCTSVKYDDYTSDPLGGADHGHQIRLSTAGGLTWDDRKSSGLCVTDQWFTIDARYEELYDLELDSQDIGMDPAPRTDVEEFYRTVLEVAISNVPGGDYITDASELYKAATDIGDEDDSKKYRSWSYYRGPGTEEDDDDAKHSAEFEIHCNDNQSGRIAITSGFTGIEYFREDEVTVETTLWVDYDGSDITLRKYRGI